MKLFIVTLEIKFIFSLRFPKHIRFIQKWGREATFVLFVARGRAILGILFSNHCRIIGIIS